MTISHPGLEFVIVSAVFGRIAYEMHTTNMTIAKYAGIGYINYDVVERWAISR
jgi:hypothetical protein